MGYAPGGLHADGCGWTPAWLHGHHAVDPQHGLELLGWPQVPGLVFPHPCTGAVEPTLLLFASDKQLTQACCQVTKSACWHADGVH